MDKSPLPSRLCLLLAAVTLLPLPAAADDDSGQYPRAAAGGPARPAPRGRVQLPAPDAGATRTAPGTQPSVWNSRSAPSGGQNGGQGQPAAPGGGQSGNPGGYSPGGNGHGSHGGAGWTGPSAGTGAGDNHQHRWLHQIPRALPRDYGRWSGGHWIHGDHDGYAGWWWVVGLNWYFYDSPYYPYPSPDVATTVIVEDGGTAYGSVPATGGQATGESGYWYCQDPQGYYPDVQSCNVEWTMVAATAPRPVPTQPQAQAYWYYCPNPQGYYPSVPSCSVNWMPVLATPAPPPPDNSTPSPTAYWYYCQSPRGYYPHVGICNSDWIPVPAR